MPTKRDGRKKTISPLPAGGGGTSFSLATAGAAVDDAAADEDTADDEDMADEEDAADDEDDEAIEDEDSLVDEDELDAWAASVGAVVWA